ncbi:MAG: tRNA-dihydrouridine synthase [Patescibacteria group bacterium]
MSIDQPQSPKTFWESLPKPFFVLAPLANVTDSVFRKLIAKHGKPDVLWTEFVSADGLVSPGREVLLHDLKFSKTERPIVAQLFTGHPDAMRKAATLVKELGFDGLDINMGCPDRAVEKQGGGAAHMKDSKTAIEVIQAAREGAAGLPISVKTRIGYNKVEMEWIRALLELRLPALTVHLRTRKEMSEVAAHWELMPEIIKLRNEISPETLIIGNGDVLTIEEAKSKTEKYGCDGVMIGRGIFGTPWLFENIRKEGKKQTSKNAKQKTPEERLKIMVEHAKSFEKTFKGIKNFAVMKKHFKAYVSGWDGAKELRVKLMETNSAKEVTKIVKEYLAN